MKSLKTFASVAAAGLLIGGAAMAAENTNGSVPFAPSAWGPCHSNPCQKSGVQPIPVSLLTQLVRLRPGRPPEAWT